jgi:hypothetical protein
MVDPVRHETASRINGLLWTPARDASSGGEPGQNEVN